MGIASCPPAWLPSCATTYSETHLSTTVTGQDIKTKEAGNDRMPTSHTVTG